MRVGPQLARALRLHSKEFGWFTPFPALGVSVFHVGQSDEDDVEHYGQQLQCQRLEWGEKMPDVWATGPCETRGSHGMDALKTSCPSSNRCGWRARRWTSRGGDTVIAATPGAASGWSFSTRQGWPIGGVGLMKRVLRPSPGRSWLSHCSGRAR